jgi:transposase InsO family protein
MRGNENLLLITWFLELKSKGEKGMKDRTDKALEFYRIIAPLLTPGLETAEKRALREHILTQEKLSERTLRRLIEKYRKGKLEGLKPKERSDRGETRAIRDEIIAEAIKLKEELPYRSVRRLLEILEHEGKIKPEEVAVSTLSRILRNKGQTTRDFKLKKEKGLGSRRFQKPHKGMLWQTDIKYGPGLPDPENPKKTRRTYLLAFLDDATRLIVHGEFYFHQRLPILEDCFRKALISWGICNAVYLDNGKIFVSKWFRAACAHLGIQHLAAARYSPQSKGKLERFNRTVDEFLEELRLEPLSTLKELNYKFQLWLQEIYHKRPHRGLPIKEGTNVHLSPLEAWEGDTNTLRSITPEECKSAFLWVEERHVDKTGCFSLYGTALEAGAAYVGQKIEVRYDPFDLSIAEVWQNNEKKAMAKALEIKEYNGRKRKRNAIEKAPQTGSRLLKSLEKEKKERIAKRQGIISYKKLNKKGDEN